MTLFYRRTNRLLERSMEGILDSNSTGWRRSNVTFYRRTNRLLGKSMEGILDSSSTGWIRSNMTCLYKNQQTAGEEYGRDPGLQFYWLEKV
jgi:hypothetical protein